MKTIFLKSSLLVLLLGFSLFSCKKEDVESKTGSLVVNVRDATGGSVIGYDVYLYNNQADFNNVIYTKKLTSNNSGQVKFENLSPAVYYVDCDYQTTGGQSVNVSGNGSVSAGYETTITIKP